MVAECRSEMVRGFLRVLAVLAPVAGCIGTMFTTGALAERDAPIGSAAYLLDYARGYMTSGDFTAAADYASQALGVDPGNGEALAILSAARQRQAPEGASAAIKALGGDPQRIGTPAYFMRYARYHFDNADYDSATEYAKQALDVDPDFAEAKAMLADSSGRASREQPAKGSCDAVYRNCWSGAMTYTPGSGFSADNARRQMCMVERNICDGGRK
jgi:tetratricopeptide (TPR) repeat protein